MKFFKKDLGKLYQQFKGKSNTNEVLIEKAKVLAPLLVGIVTENAESLFTELQKDRHRKVDKNRFGEVFYEMILFYLHSVDRFVFKSLEIEKRTTFMNALLVNVRDILARRRGTNNISVFHDAFVEAYNERQIEYGKYKKWLPENGEGAKDTLLWEFGKKIASILGSEKDIMVIMYVRTYFINAMKVLKLSDIFS